VSLHYLVKYRFSKITTVHIDIYAKTILLKQAYTIFCNSNRTRNLGKSPT